MSNVPCFPGWDLDRSPFHDGELAVQARVGVREKIDAQGRRVVRRYMTDQHREFFSALPYAFLGSVDAAGQPWASMIVGPPGFMRTPDAHTIHVGARPLSGDPLNTTLREGAEVALLGVQLPTRRRNRVIGVVTATDETGFAIGVRQTLGICPQYIQGREVTFTDDLGRPERRPVHRADRLDAAAQAIIAKADTFFVASVDPRAEDGVAKGADVSHRGGRPGFVRIDDDVSLTTPDFVGNFIFNTLGNFQIDSRAGLLFVDFATGDTLHLAARAEIIWDGPELAAFAGAQRLVRYRISQVIRVERALPLIFSAPDYSPLIQRTGTWTEAARTLEAEASRNEWRSFRIARVEIESANVRSFYLEPDDGRGVAGYKPGQFLPIRVRCEGRAEAAIRTYTLSDAPGGARYRISVKREGRGGISDWLHDHARAGTPIEALTPRGSFTFVSEPKRPVVLVSAGIGITPMLAMVNDLLVNNGRTRHHAPIYFVHGARNGDHSPFAGYLKAKAELHANLKVHFSFSEPLPSDAIGVTHDSAGHVDLALLKRILPFDDYDFYLCGPGPFMQALYDGLTGLGVRDARIHLESFGPATVKRQAGSRAVAPDEAEEGVQVTFSASKKVTLWRPRDGSLLDLAEREGITALHSCRSGVCGTCAARVIAGAVAYAEPPAHEVAEGDALICVATPRPGAHLDNSPHREGVILDL